MTKYGNYKKFICLFAAVCMILFPLRVQAHTDYGTEEIKMIMDQIMSWKKSEYDPEKPLLLNEQILANAGNSSADWIAFAEARCGYPDDYETYKTALERYVVSAFEELKESPIATDMQRIAIVLASLGGNPADIEGIDLLKESVYGREQPLSGQGLNAYIFGLLALDSVQYVIPEDTGTDRNVLIQGILDHQLEDGAFTLSGSAPDIDITAMALAALAPYYEAENGSMSVKAAVNKALTYLSDAQNQDGGFRAFGYDSMETTAQVLIALSSLKIDCAEDERFMKNGNTVLDGLMQYRLENGGFAHKLETDEADANAMSSIQALYALCSYYRYLSGLRPLYDTRPEEGHTGIINIFTGQEMEDPPVGVRPAEIASDKKTSFLKPIAVAAVVLTGMAGVSFIVFMKKKSRVLDQTSYEDEQDW